MPLISIFVFLENIAFEVSDILIQDLKNVEIILFGKKNYYPELEFFPEVRFIQFEGDLNSFESQAINVANGEYVLFRYKNEKWSKNFLFDLKQFITQSSLSGNRNILYLEGFYDAKDRIAFVNEINPETQSLFSLHKIFSGPQYFVPGVKFLIPLSIIKNFDCKFNINVHNVYLRHALFNLEFLTAFYQYNNYSQPQIIRKTSEFRVPLQYLKPNGSEIYFDTIWDKREVWRKNIWSYEAFKSFVDTVPRVYRKYKNSRNYIT
jgi:hypothetical protein